MATQHIASPSHRFHSMLVDAIRHEDDWRKRAEQNFRYYEGDQWTKEEVSHLDERGQQATVINICRPQIDSLHAIYAQRKTSIKVMGREPSDDGMAHVATHLLKQMEDDNSYQFLESQWFRQGAVGGIGWMMLTVDSLEGTSDEDPDVTVEGDIRMIQVPLEDIFFDPYGRSMDGSDFQWICRRVWMDLSKAKELFGEKGEMLRSSSAELADPFKGAEDHAQSSSGRSGSVQYFDADTSRVAVYEMWYRTPSRKVKQVIFSYDTFLRGGPDDSDNDDPLDINEIPFVPFIASRTRRGLPQGLLDWVIPLQDSLNKLYSKWQWNMMSRQFLFETGAVIDEDSVRNEIAKPDGMIKLEVGGLNRVMIPKNIDESAHLSSMMQFIMQASQRVSGINDAVLGFGGVNARSAEQESSRQIAGAQMQTGIVENMFASKKRLMTLAVRLMGRHYTMPRIVRVLGDNNRAEFYRINEPFIDTAGNTVSLTMADVLRFDIILSIVPAFSTVRQHQINAITEVGKAGLLPPDIMAEIIIGLTDLPDKERLLERVRAISQQPQPAP